MAAPYINHTSDFSKMLEEELDYVQVKFSDQPNKATYPIEYYQAYAVINMCVDFQGAKDVSHLSYKKLDLYIDVSTGHLMCYNTQVLKINQQLLTQLETAGFKYRKLLWLSSQPLHFLLI